MKIFITGGLGFIGRHLTQFFLDKGHRVTVVGLRPGRKVFDHDRFLYISADTTQKGPWLKNLQDTDVIINLAGKTIFKRWTKHYKKLIYNSRILSTRNLVEAIPEKNELIFCSTSATGYYGNGGDALLTEDAPNGDDFLAEVSMDWETEAFRAREKGARVVITRFGTVLGNNGGIMQKMIPAFRFYVGGPIGNGAQWFPWIHMDDLLSAFQLVIVNKNIHGVLNFCSPHPVRNREFAESLGHILNKPSFMPAPSFMIRLLMGEFGSAILASQRAVSEKLLAYGFKFKYPDIKESIENIVANK